MKKGYNKKPDGVGGIIQPMPRSLKDYVKQQENLKASKRRKNLYERLDKLESSNDPEEVALAKRLRSVLNSCTSERLRYKGKRW